MLEPYGFLQMLFGISVRSGEDGLEPSQTYGEVNKLLLLLHAAYYFTFMSTVKATPHECAIRTGQP